MPVCRLEVQSCRRDRRVRGARRARRWHARAVADIEDCAAKLRSFTITLFRNDEQRATGRGANVLGSPLLALAHLAKVLAQQSSFAPVKAGEIVTTGTLTELQSMTPGDTWSTNLDGIDLPGLSITATGSA